MQLLDAGARINLVHSVPSGAAVAQLTVNQLVAGSNPASGAYMAGIVSTVPVSFYRSDKIACLRPGNI